MPTIIRTEIEIFSGFADDPADKKPFVIGYNNDGNWNLVFGDSIEECIKADILDAIDEDELWRLIRKRDAFYFIYGLWTAQEKLRAVREMKELIKSITGESSLSRAKYMCEKYLS